MESGITVFRYFCDIFCEYIHKLILFQVRHINIGATASYNSSTKKYDGTYGLKLLVSKWKDRPVIQLTKDGSITQDFYAPNDGTTNLTTGPDGTGTGIVAWLGSTGYVTKWYDQTGNGNHGTGTTTTTNTPLANYPFIGFWNDWVF